MKDNTKNVRLELTLAQRRQRLADALGFLLARAWRREHGSAAHDRPASVEPDLQQVQPVENPP